MTEHETSTTALPSRSGSPMVFRSSYRRAEQARTASAALIVALACTDRWDRSRALLAVARRPDLTAKVLNQMARNDGINRDTQWISALFTSNRGLARTDAARSLIHDDMLPLLLTAPDGLEDVIVDVLSRMHHGSPTAQTHMAMARQAIPAATLTALTLALTETPHGAREVASSVLMTDTIWTHLLDRLPRTKKAARQARGEHWPAALIETLMRRPELTEDRASRLITALGSGRDAMWRLTAMFGSPACPAAVYTLGAKSPDRDVAEAALGAMNCPNEARFVGILAGHLIGLLKVHSPIPDDVARHAVHLLATPVSRGHRALSDKDHWDSARILARFAGAPDVLDWSLARYREHHRNEPAALAAFYDDVLGTHSTSVYIWGPLDRLDIAMDYLAGHPDGAVRALAVPRLSADELPMAALDPHEAVRFNVADHPHLSPETRQILRGDPSGSVRARVVPDLAPDALDTEAQDPDEIVRVEVARHPDLNAHLITALSNDPSPQVRAIIADRFLAALATSED